MVVIAIVVAACTPASNVGRSPSTSTPSSSPNDIPSPTGSAAPTSEPSPTASTGWQQAASMVYPRIIFRSVLLTDGTLLVVGDDGCGLQEAIDGSERAEVYDPATDRWTEVGSLNKPRGMPELVPLPDGRAMVLGGFNQTNEWFSSTKVYSPVDRTWSEGPLMIRAGTRGAVALPDGTVIAVGPGQTEILDPGATSWRRSTSPNIVVRRLMLLGGGVVFAIGASKEGDAAFATFDPASRKWGYVDAQYPSWSDFVALADGSILILGQDEGGSHVERYDPATQGWTPTARMGDGRVGAQVTLLADGRVLAAGGMSISSHAVDGGYSVTEDGVSDTTEIYDPEADTWIPGPPLRSARQGGYAMTMRDGSVLVYGGHGPWSPPPSPDTGSTECPPPIAETERLYVVP
jgi:hypothetical protein